MSVAVVTVVGMVVRMLVMAVVVSVLGRGSLLHPAGKPNPDLHRLNPASVDGTHRDADLRNPETSGETFDPADRSASPDEGPEKHVAADPGGRVDYSEASV